MEKINWNLNDLYNLDEFDSLYKSLEKDLIKLKKDLESLNPNMPVKTFQQIVKSLENISDKTTKLYAYPMLWEEIENTNKEAKYLKSRVNNLIISESEVTRVFTHWIAGKKVNDLDVLDDKNAERLFNSISSLTYLFNFEKRVAHHMLDLKTEQIITNKDIYGGQTLLNIRSLLDAKAKYEITINGKKKTINTTAELMQLVHDKDKKTRETAYRALFDYYKNYENEYFAIYESIVKDWNYEAKLRGYKDAISVRNLSNDLPDDVIKTLLSSCSQNISMFQRFFKLKAKALKEDKLQRFDLYAPIIFSKNEKKYTYEESLDLVSDVFKDFDNDFYNNMRAIVDKKHIDAFPKHGKSSGAFCAYVGSKLEPYVMLNFLGEKRDVMTMAHELGHGVHGIFSQKQSVLAQDAPIPISETASTFAETLVFERLYKDCENNEERIQMLFNRLADSYATIIRQNYFVLFEIEAHKYIPEGIRLDEMYSKYLDNLKSQFGDSVEVNDVFKYEWLYISHIFNSPFYCYAYSFGELLALAFYEQYIKDKKGAVNNIKKILTIGSSANYVDELAKVGVDIKRKDVWNLSFKYIEDLLNRLEELLKKM